jgi:hypothetical protein
MGRYSARESRKPLGEASKGTHAVWRGIGCLMILIIPILSVALAYETFNYGIEQKWLIPYQLLGTPRLPDIFYDVRILRQLSFPIRQTVNFYGYALASILYLIVIGGFISVLYAFVYRLTGPARYGPFDAPPPTIKTKRYKR